MYSTSTLPERLKSFNYYLNKLPLFLQQSSGFVGHFQIWFDIMIGQSSTQGLIPAEDTILNLINIFDPDYLQYINALDDADSGQVSDILDKAGRLFGVIRRFSVSYLEDNVVVTEQLSLNNSDFLLLIKTAIIKNYCEGTTEQIERYYAYAGLNVFLITTPTSAIAHLYLVEIQGSVLYSDNVKKMFKSGLLRIDSMGIQYQDSSTVLTGFLEWDAPAASQQGWGKGFWSL